jgi:alkylation response protein AidB-like acyl-CoA dehydrogenase
MQVIIWNQEESRYDVPVGPFAIGLGMCGPTMMAYASEQQKRELLPRMASGEHVWCQLFSEPAGGSDLAALRTKAERDGDEWVINGQKIWTSGAHYSDWGILVTRSDPSVPKHKGLTFFFLNMHSPGVTVKPIKQISGDANFNGFISDVRIPDAQRLGAVGQGWQVSLTTLMNERLAVGNGADFEALDLASASKSMAHRQSAIRRCGKSSPTGTVSRVVCASPTTG